jgi:predicted aspartyl protease
LARNVFVSSKPPYINIRLRFEPPGPELEVEALVDTGFDGDISMPPISLPAEVKASAVHFMTLANGSINRAHVFKGTAAVMGIDEPHEVSILVGTSEFLVGRRFTDHFRVTFDHGREVTVEP